MDFLLISENNSLILKEIPEQIYLFTFVLNLRSPPALSPPHDIKWSVPNTNFMTVKSSMVLILLLC